MVRFRRFFLSLFRNAERMFHRSKRLTYSRICIVRSYGSIASTVANRQVHPTCVDPNIVQYRGYARTDSALYIILEYCENGSLSAIIKKFGRFPESLVGLYTLQVLQGLLYLHDQGVIHRDIKGSNILATKEGSIKRTFSFWLPSSLIFHLSNVYSTLKRIGIRKQSQISVSLLV